MLWLALACTDVSPGTALSRLPSDAIQLTLPERSRPTPADARVALSDWEKIDERCWKAPFPGQIPVDFSTGKRPKGVRLEGPLKLGYNPRGGTNSWQIRQGQVQICLGPKELTEHSPPQDWFIADPRAAEKEARLNLADSALEAQAFVRGSIPDGDRHHRGLYLPAPATASMSVRIPDGGTLGLDLGLLAAPFSTGKSDGALLHVDVEVDGARTRVRTLKVPTDGFKAKRVDLSAWEGQSVTLHLITDPKDSAALDYVMLREPALYTPTTRPKRLVLVFVDTLRPDHLGVYGYERETSPAIDAWSKDARIFTQARSVAPWTLPSARAALSGRMPEHWEPSQSLPARLRDAGYLSHAIIGNAFLSPGFEMGTEWSGYELGFLPQASTQVDRSLEILEQWPDRDVAILLHLMDPHMPYREPESHRSLWAGERPKELEKVGIGRDGLRRLREVPSQEAQDYVVARYDQNIRWSDDSLARLFEALDKRATVALFSDHGEEFWENGGVEHGHSLDEELLRVPFLLKGPGIQAGTDTRQVSLLDLTPTLLAALELPPLQQAQGRDLLSEASQPPLGLGYTLYGADAWGVLDGQHKLVLSEGQGRVYSLAEPGWTVPEESALRGAWSSASEQAFGRPIVRVWRLNAGQGDDKKLAYKISAEVQVEGALATWKAYDPLGVLSEPSLSPTGALLSAKDKGERAPREWYVSTLPELAPGHLIVDTNQSRETDFDVDSAPQSAGSMGRRYTISPAWTIAPPQHALGAVPEELEEMLRAAGYLD